MKPSSAKKTLRSGLFALCLPLILLTAFPALAGSASADTPAQPPQRETLSLDGETVSFTRPAGYVAADEVFYARFLALIRTPLDGTDVALHSTWIPAPLDSLVKKNLATPVTKHLCLMTAESLGSETYSRGDFKYLQSLYREDPDLLLDSDDQDTRREGPAFFTETATLCGFATISGTGEDYTGVMALVHTGKKIVYLYLFEAGDDPETLDALKAEMPALIRSMDFTPPTESNTRPFFVVGLALLALAGILWLIFMVRESKPS